MKQEKKKNKVLILQGLPASGKSTYAKNIMEKEKNWKRINKDLLREMFDFSKWSNIKEGMVVEARNILLNYFLEDGYNVIIDDTNFNKKHINIIKEIAENFDADVEIKLIDTPLYECIERDKKRQNPVGKNVILNMYKKYLRKNEISPEFNIKYKSWIICDIDGTLAYSPHRSPYDLSLIKFDKPNKHLIHILKQLSEEFFVVIMSGREETSKEETLGWINANNIPCDRILMRKKDDNRADEIVKKELFETYIKGANVFCVFDDRPKVIRMWKELGLMVFDCNLNDPRIDF